jgi:hypothetical protein
MTVFVLIREDQNEYGYVDPSIAGVFREAGGAKEMETPGATGGACRGRRREP